MQCRYSWSAAVLTTLLGLLRYSWNLKFTAALPVASPRSGMRLQYCKLAQVPRTDRSNHQ